MAHHRRKFSSLGKSLLAVFLLNGCAVNPATGDWQFTMLMSPSKEASQGKEQNDQIEKTYGRKYAGTSLENYIDRVGQRIAKNAERKDVAYHFAVLDSPTLNAFALPGGYVYVTRGLLALTNSEDELAGVLAHETGHIAARHIAERYSQGVLASFGAAALAIALNSPDASQALGMGSQLYTSSYSRDQESEADALGVRYLSKAGYDPLALSHFLRDLDRYTKLQGGGSSIDFFATHPQTADRVAQAEAEAAKYTAQPKEIIDPYLTAIDGMAYGDSPEQGFIRGQTFFHPELGITFNAPEGFALSNMADQVVAHAADDALLLFDGTANPKHLNPSDYLAQVWLEQQKVEVPVAFSISGHPAATVSFASTVKGKPVRIRLIAVAWDADRLYRFQLSIPVTADQAEIDALKASTASLRSMTEQELKTIQPYHVVIVAAKPGDTTAALVKETIFNRAPEAEFRALNGMDADEKIVPGRRYKVIKD